MNKSFPQMGARTPWNTLDNSKRAFWHWVINVEEKKKKRKRKERNIHFSPLICEECFSPLCWGISFYLYIPKPISKDLFFIFIFYLFPSRKVCTKRKQAWIIIFNVRPLHLYQEVLITIFCIYSLPTGTWWIQDKEFSWWILRRWLFG